MKKSISLLLALLLALTCAAPAFAEGDGMGVQLISGPEEEEPAEPVSLDDMQIDAEAEVPGCGIVCLTSFEFADMLGVYPWDAAAGIGKYEKAGEEAEFAILRLDITNTTTSEKDFLADCEVRVFFDEDYEYGGWKRQSNYDNRTWSFTNMEKNYEPDLNRQNERWAIDVKDQFPIEPMYVGHYIFGCTLPNAVVDSDKPLRMVITLDGNELTYNIRK